MQSAIGQGAAHRRSDAFRRRSHYLTSGSESPIYRSAGDGDRSLKVTSVPLRNPGLGRYPRPYVPITGAKTSLVSSRRVGQERRRTSSFLSVAKKLSATASSKQSPLDPIERAMPASRADWPKASETYWAPWSL
jgi:hypothetical protein